MKQYLLDTDQDKTDNMYNFQLAEDVTFLHKASNLATLNIVPDGSQVVIDGSKSISIHPDEREIIKNFETRAIYANVNLEIIGMKDGTQPNPYGDFTDRVVKNK